LNTDGSQFFHAVLSGLGFQFSGSPDKWHQSQMDKERVLLAKRQPHLPDSFEKRLAFNIADRTSDFHDDHFIIAGDRIKGVFLFHRLRGE